MNVFARLLLLSGIFVISCGGSNEPEAKLQFSRMEIHYTKSGGWINTSRLFIYSDGSVTAFTLSQTKGDTLKSGTLVLSEEDRVNLAYLFEPFSTFEPYYEPENPSSDQDLHTTIFIYEDVPDTVMVYMPEEADIPEGLWRIIEEMESLLDYILG
ncbi:MAG: hypothetical protein ACE5OP_11555 [Candidatus Glassbacteria bacterium]